MPIGKFQSEVLRALAAQRSPDSYIAGGVAINREGPRFSGDIDIFHDSEARLESAAEADAAALTAAGYGVTWGRVREGKREAAVTRGSEAMQLEWATDAAFRFFPTQPDELFGYVLHPADLATNKAAAAADRRVPRDIVDLVTTTKAFCHSGRSCAQRSASFPVSRRRKCLPKLPGTATSQRRNSKSWRPSSQFMSLACTAVYAP